LPDVTEVPKSFESKRKAFPPLTGLAVAGSVTCLFVFLLGGQDQLEKTLKALFAPVGIIWLGLLAQATVLFWSNKTKAALFSIGLWLLLTIAGNQLVAIWANRHLEAPFLETKVNSLGEFDAVLVLGGTTSMTPAGDLQGGSRVFAAVRLFHSGKIKKLLVSGEQQSRASDDDLDPGQEAKLMLVQSGVPESAIEVLGGINTFEEIECLEQWLKLQATPNSRLGIISDASHLARALALCKARGFEAIGIPSGFGSNPFVPTPSLVIPSASNLSATQSFIYETLGRFIGR
jgi:uncharacterized SAM-binding protein YcdF (DUF218 family)